MIALKKLLTIEFLKCIEELLQFAALCAAVETTETRLSSSALVTISNMVITIVDVQKFPLDISSLNLAVT